MLDRIDKLKLISEIWFPLRFTQPRYHSFNGPYKLHMLDKVIKFIGVNILFEQLHFKEDVISHKIGLLSTESKPRVH